MGAGHGKRCHEEGFESRLHDDIQRPLYFKIGGRYHEHLIFVHTPIDRIAEDCTHHGQLGKGGGDVSLEFPHDQDIPLIL